MLLSLLLQCFAVLLLFGLKCRRQLFCSLFGLLLPAGAVEVHFRCAGATTFVMVAFSFGGLFFGLVGEDMLFRRVFNVRFGYMSGQNQKEAGVEFCFCL